MSKKYRIDTYSIMIHQDRLPLHSDIRNYEPEDIMDFDTEEEALNAFAKIKKEYKADHVYYLSYDGHGNKMFSANIAYLWEMVDGEGLAIDFCRTGSTLYDYERKENFLKKLCEIAESIAELGTFMEFDETPDEAIHAWKKIKEFVEDGDELIRDWQER